MLSCTHKCCFQRYNKAIQEKKVAAEYVATHHENNDDIMQRDN